MGEKNQQGQESQDTAAQEALKDLEGMEKALTDDEEAGNADLDALQKAIDEADSGLEKSEEEDDGEKEADEEEEDLDKSLDDLDPELQKELVKASEAYADLEKSVSELGETAGTRFESLEKSVKTQTKLAVGQAKVIGALVKGFEQAGSKPLKKSQAKLDDGLGDQALKKSRQEVKDALEKAMGAGIQLPPNCLSILDAYGVDAVLQRIPEATLDELGLK